MDRATYDKDRILEIIPSKELRLIPLHIIIIHIYEEIIENASNCEVSYVFNIDRLIKEYELKKKIATPDNKLYIINEIKRLFPGIKITEIGEPTNCNSYLMACWEEELDVYKPATVDGDCVLDQAIQLSLNEAKYSERTNNSIMGKKAEERLQKYKKL